MPKFNKPLDFYLGCNCFLQAQKSLRAQGIDLLGISQWSDKKGNSGLAVPILKRLINPDGSRQQGILPLTFCPFCGKQIATGVIRRGNDEPVRKIE